ncbi:MAG TPA: hypothetical protein DIC42_03290 [Holosporales bacterium]|nr:hypothetical protein [Holosporales bacterium]
MRLLFIFLLTHNVFGGFYCLKPEALGDAEQQAGIIWFLQQKPEIIEEAKAAELLAKIKEDTETVVLLTTGSSGVSFITENMDFLKNVKTIHTSHILDDKCKSLLGVVDVLAVPSYTVGCQENKGKTQILKTTGVSHLTILEQDLEALKKKLDITGSKFSLKIMGGDAPDEKGVIQFYSTAGVFSADSEALSDVMTISEGTTLLISNGPRTGLYGIDQKKNNSAHQDGKVDYVTKSYVASLKNYLAKNRSKKPKNITLKVIDFQFGKKGPSISDLFSLVKLTGGKVIVAADSTTTLSKAFDIFPGEVIVEVNTATNKTHLKHIKAEHNRYALVLGRMLRFCEIDLGESLPKTPVKEILNGNTSVAAREIAKTLKEVGSIELLADR